MSNFENTEFNKVPQHIEGRTTSGILAADALSNRTGTNSEPKGGVDGARQAVREIDLSFNSDSGNPEYQQKRIAAGLNLLQLLLKEKDSTGRTVNLKESADEFRKDVILTKLTNDADRPWIYRNLQSYADELNGHVLANEICSMVLAAKADSVPSAADIASQKLSCGFSQSYTQASLDLATDIVKHTMQVNVVRDGNMSVQSIDFGDGIYLRKPGAKQTPSCSQEKVAEYANPPFGFRRSTGSVFVDAILER